MTADDLRALARANPAISAILATPTLLPDPWLVAGCLAQTVWNHQAGTPLTHGINDYDLVYFDARDLSAATEAAHEARLRTTLGLKLDVKNQARVHVWYEAKFGRPTSPYPDVPTAIDTYPATATTIGLRLSDLHLHASFGLEDLAAGILRHNPKLATIAVFSAKAARWQGVWPHLRISNP